MAANRLPRYEQALLEQEKETRLDPAPAAFDVVQRREQHLRELELQLVPLRRELAAAALQLERDIREMGELSGRWERTLEQAELELPAPAQERARETRRALEAAQRNLADEQALVLGLQGRVADLTSGIAALRDRQAASGGRALLRLFRQDGAPVWQPVFWSGTTHAAAPGAYGHLRAEWAALAGYLGQQGRMLLAHLMLIAVIAAALFAVRTRVGALSEIDQGLSAKRAVFDMPVVSGILLGLLASESLYPSPPAAFPVALGLVAAPVVYLFTRRLVEREAFPLFQMVIAFYVIDQLRSASAPLPAINRLFLLLESLAILLFLLRFGISWSGWTVEIRARTGTRVALLIARAMLVVALGVLLAAALGFGGLADLLQRASLSSAYAAIVLYALSRALGGVVQALLHVPPLSLAAGVRRHRDTIANRVSRWLGWAAVVYWLVFTLRAFGLLGLAIDLGRIGWDASWSIGSLQISASAVLIFVLIFGITYLVSRLVRFFLEEEIFSRVQLDRGLSHTVSTSAHYLILVIGFALALSATGIDMTRFAIVAGALTVGIGFGLQNIVNNFVSGLIVLFERPVKVGDTIQMGDMVGRVRQIGIRATIIESTSGASVIVPNGKLISDQVTNWTLSGQLRQIAVPVIAKAAELSADQMRTLLLDVAHRNDDVLDLPQPEVLLLKRNVDTLEFELRVWTHALDEWVTIRSDLIGAIDRAFRQRAQPDS